MVILKESNNRTTLGCVGRQLEGVLGSGQTIGGRSGERADNLRAFRRGCGRLESVPPQNLEEGGGVPF